MTEDYKKLAVEAFKLNLKIKKNTLELKKMKIELREKMINANAKKIMLDEGEINAIKWKSNFSSLIRKEFNKLDNSKKKELYKTGLLKIQFRLDTKKFQELKDKQEKTELDEYVIERKNIVYLNFKLNEKTRKILRTENRSEHDIKLEEEDAFDDFMYEIEADERDYWNEMWQEMKPDPVYFHDDDPDNVSETEEQYVGPTTHEDDEVDTDFIDDEEYKDGNR